MTHDVLLLFHGNLCFKCVSKTDFFKAVSKTSISSDQNTYFSRLEEHEHCSIQKIRLNKYLVPYGDKIGEPQVDVVGYNRDQE